ncbi:hypothetical protein ACIHEJ_07860 [Streptomyces sp. NPDC052301]|uniref:hypothetical protein n=1 Tax=Streptomyces sp. NPDC052301 TaxID=3365687 RepID=UPI0037D43C0E
MRTVPRRLLREVLPLALTGLLALSACQFTGHGDDKADEAHRLNTMKAFPLHAYLPDPSSDEGRTIGKAQWILAKRCMVRLGFAGFAALDPGAVDSTYPVRQGTLADRSTVGSDDSPYGVDDPEPASEHGYHNRAPEDSAQPQEWPADQYTALTGSFRSGDSHLAHGNRIPDGGCLGQATRKIYGAPPETVKAGGLKVTSYYSLALELGYQSQKQARNDPAWKKTEHAWSACMKKKGFRYADPDKAATDYAWYRDDKPSDREKRTAAADAQCKLDTDYIRTAHDLETRLQKAAISKHRTELDQVLAANARAVENARTIIGTAS